MPHFINSELNEALEAVLAWVLDHAPDTFGFDAILHAADLENDEAGYLTALAIANAISAGRTPLVDVSLEYDAKNGQRYRIVPIRDAVTEQKYIIDPVTSVRVDDFESRTYLLFSRKQGHPKPTG